MEPVSVRLSSEVASKLEAYCDAEQHHREAGTRQLLADGLERRRRQRALKRLAAGEVTLTRAAKTTDTSPWEFTRSMKRQDVTCVSEEHLAADLDAL